MVDIEADASSTSASSSTRDARIRAAKRWLLGIGAFKSGDSCTTYFMFPFAQWIFLAIRLIFTLYSWGVILTAIVYEGQDYNGGIHNYWLYHTNWSYTALVIYLTMAAIGTIIWNIAGVVDKKKGRDPGSFLPQKRAWRFFEYYQWMSFHLALVNGIGVFLLYWFALNIPCLQTKPFTECMNPRNQFYSFSSHGINAVFIVIDGLLNNIPVVPTHVFFVLLFIFGWEINAGVWIATTGRYAYPSVMNPDNIGKALSILFYPIYPLLYVVIFAFAFAGWCCKRKILDYVAAKRSQGGVAAAAAAEEKEMSVVVHKEVQEQHEEKEGDDDNDNNNKKKKESGEAAAPEAITTTTTTTEEEEQQRQQQNKQ